MARKDSFRKLAFDAFDAYADFDPYGVKDAKEIGESWTHYRNRVARVMAEDTEQIHDCVVAMMDDDGDMKARAEVLLARYNRLCA